MAVKLLTVFNNKGGVGKTTLTFHLAHALAELGKKTLIIDLDPQCNLTIYSLTEEQISDIWIAEDPFVEDFAAARLESPKSYADLIREARSIHFCLKPTEDGTAEHDALPPPFEVTKNLYLLPGRLTLHMFEAKVSERWPGVYTGDPLSIRTTTRIRSLALEYAATLGFDVVILDTSPSLGSLNRTILSLADAFIIPGAPDLFSLYGIKNIGNALSVWRRQFESIFHFLSDDKRKSFPKRFVKFVGFTLYNAKKLTGARSTNHLGIAQAHYNYAQKIPQILFSAIGKDNMIEWPEEQLKNSIGGDSVIWSHNTFPSMAQKYNLPMWKLPHCGKLEDGDISTISGNQKMYSATQESYHAFAADVIKRLEAINE